VLYKFLYGEVVISLKFKLVEALIEEMRRTKIIIPAMSTVERLAWETRRRAQNQFYLSLTKHLTPIQKTELDGLLIRFLRT
jgi:hypothetical protein